MMTQEKYIGKRAFPDYRGRKFRAEQSGAVCFHDVNWSGGTKNSYRSLRLYDGKLASLPDLPPWANPIEGKTVAIPPGFVVVQHTVFCGRDLGITVYYAAQKRIAVTIPEEEIT